MKAGMRFAAACASAASLATAVLFAHLQAPGVAALMQLAAFCR